MSGIDDERMLTLQGPQSCAQVLGAGNNILPHRTLVQAPNGIVVTAVYCSALQVVGSPAAERAILRCTIQERIVGREAHIGDSTSVTPQLHPAIFVAAMEK